MQTTVITPTASAVTEQRLSYKPAAKCDEVTFSADVLAGAETIQIYIKVGETLKAITAIDSTGAGVVVTLNADLPSVTLPNGPNYYATKSATADACGLYCDSVD